MKKLLPFVPLAILCVGCGSAETPKDDSALRAELSQKEIDYSKAPPEQRAPMLAAMRANGAAAKADELEKQWGMKK